MPRNEYLIAGINRDATTFDFPSKNLHLADTDLDMKYQILDGDFDIPTLSAVFSMRLPTAEAEYGQEAVDIAVGVVGQLEQHHSITTQLKWRTVVLHPWGRFDNPSQWSLRTHHHHRKSPAR